VENMYQVMEKLPKGTWQPASPAAYGKTAQSALRWWRGTYRNNVRRGAKYKIGTLLSRGNPGKKNPVSRARSVRLKNFTGTISKLRGGGVKITGRQKRKR